MWFQQRGEGKQKKKILKDWKNIDRGGDWHVYISTSKKQFTELEMILSNSTYDRALIYKYKKNLETRYKKKTNNPMKNRVEI